MPEPELTLVVNARGAIVGFCAGNDVSSRDIEGENPLYLPQAKIYDGSCALGPGIVLCDVDELQDLSIELVVQPLARDWHELPCVLGLAEREPEDTERVVLARFAIGGRLVERIQLAKAA